MILVPLPMAFDLSFKIVSLTTWKVELAIDSHLYCSSSFDFEMTTTLLATKYEE